MLDLIVNRNAKKGKGKRMLEEVVARLDARGAQYRVFFPEQRGEIATIASRLSREKDQVLVAMGGDGTLNEVLCGIDDPANAVLGVIPTGTGNDFAAAAGIPEGAAAVDLLLDGEPVYTDYLECGDGKRSMNIAGLGIDVDILKRCEKKHGTSRGKYFRSLLAALCRYRPLHMEVTADGETKPYDALIAAACNGDRFGGGIPICPPARIDDGKLDLVVVDCPRRALIPFELIRLMKGKILQRPIAHHLLCDEVRIVPDSCDFIQLDGELVAADKLCARVVSGKLKLYRRPHVQSL